MVDQVDQMQGPSIVGIAELPWGTAGQVGKVWPIIMGLRQQCVHPVG